MIELKANLLDMGTGGPLIVLLDDDTAKTIGVFVGDRIRVTNGKKSIICTINLAKEEPQDTIGIFREAATLLKIKNKQKVTVRPVPHPASLEYIRAKLKGAVLNLKEMRTIVTDIAENRLTEVEIAYFVAGATTHGFSLKETSHLTRSMITTGTKLKWPKKAVSKHCIGGISGNRTTMIVVPIIAAAGILMPKTSSRSITSPSGTADTMEILAPVNINSVRAIRKIVGMAKGSIVWGGALNLAPADDKIIRVEHPLSLDPTPMLLASILAKKKSEGANSVLIDIPFGKYSKVKTVERFRTLKDGFLRLGKMLGMKVMVVKSQGSAPVGKGIGPILEARDVMWVLKRDKRAPKDLEEKSIWLASILLKMGGKVRTEGGGRKLAKKLLNTGKAYEQMQKIIDAQGGNPDIDENKFKLARHTYVYKASRSGKIVEINDDLIASIAKLAGAPKAKGAGVYLHKQVRDKTLRGDAVFTVYSNSRHHLDEARRLASKVVKLK